MPLYICPTPIGNLKDITLRVLEVLKSVDYIIAEDTRITRNLLNKYEIKTPLKSFHSYSNKRVLENIVEDLKFGRSIALVSDAGTPCISDPGYDLVKRCIEEDIHFEVLPGPNAVLPAIILSGFPPDKFFFYGFLKRAEGKIKKTFEYFKEFEYPVVFYESPYRLVKVLSIMNDIFDSNRYVSVVREISKIHESVVRGSVKEVLEYFKANPPKGEIVIVLGGRDMKI
ncbi:MULTISPECIES: 16S rRNA (cytidine(1402)-2'-O)-methyltransferase [Caldisericum]|jgi:16S rRNA (cytidine1402-2'-O)-methyltransferase|uniref:Ribosomal RNA small subunit methyltransferase I n=1 Tax=Caldisericum exile TaxID=693075 RepID=A0A2J6WEQ6_9BACT|nr:MAG: 16S rRNA (cytidine(1402)-2'-O)-methyltransferase [Caldisericum exile]